MAKGTPSQTTAEMTGSCPLQDDQATDGAAAWPDELDEQLISELLNDESLLGALQVRAGDSEHYFSGDTGPCKGTVAEREQLPEPASVSRALCSVYSGPTIQDIEKALSSSRPWHWSNRRYSPMYFGRFGAASRAPDSKHTTKVRSCAGKMPSDGFKWRKYGQKAIKNNPYPRSYYKCTSSRCGAKKHVDKCVDDPEMLVVTYEGPHLHGPQPPFPRRQWAPAEFLSGVPPASSSSSARGKQLQACDDAAEARGGGGFDVAGELRGYDGQNGLRAAEDVVVTATRSCDGGGGSSTSVAAPRDGTALPCDDSPPTTWSCPHLYYYSWSPEALLP